MEPYYKTNLGQLHYGDCAYVIPQLPEQVDMVLASPPYGKLRKYKGYTFDFENTARALKEKLKPGGVIVWVVGDETVNGSETGESFRQALYFMQLGLNLHDTMIYHKETLPLTHNRYEQHFEYMFILSKGRPNTFNPILESCVGVGTKISNKIRQSSTYDRLEKSHGYGKKTKATKIKSNIWFYGIGKNKSTKDKIAFQHPATFPEPLAKDHILSWTNKGDLVLDCLAGSGTTLKQAEILKRKWYGIEISHEYCKNIKIRMEKTIKIEAMKFSNRIIQKRRRL